MRHLAKTLIALAVLALGGCADDDTTADTAQTTSTTEAPPINQCVTIGPAYNNGSVGVEGLKASTAGRTLGNGHTAWYLASTKGGLWVTDSDPAGSGGGFVAPLNDEARSESEVGSDVQPDAPILAGITAADAASSSVQAC